MSDVWVVDAVRTPIGRYAGALAGIRPDDLAATVVRELVASHTGNGLDPSAIEDAGIGIGCGGQTCTTHEESGYELAIRAQGRAHVPALPPSCTYDGTLWVR